MTDEFFFYFLVCTARHNSYSSLVVTGFLQLCGEIENFILFSFLLGKSANYH